MATFGNIVTGGSNVSAPPSGQKAVSKFTLDRAGSIDHLLFQFNGGGLLGSTVAVIYDNTGVGGLPGALLGVSSSVAATSTQLIAFPFSGLTLNAGSYWVGLLAATGSAASCQSLTNGIAFNVNAGSASNPFGASPSLAGFQYPVVVFYTPTLPGGTAYGNTLGGDALTHQYVSSQVIVFKITIPVPGSISKLTTFLQNNFPSAKIKGIIYSDSAGSPNALLGTTTELVGPVINGNDLSFASPIAVAPGDYWIGAFTDTSMGVFHKVDSTPNAIGNATYPSVPGTFPVLTSGTGSWCLWATFTADFIPPGNNGNGKGAGKGGGNGNKPPKGGGIQFDPYGRYAHYYEGREQERGRLRRRRLGAAATLGVSSPLVARSGMSAIDDAAVGRRIVSGLHPIDQGISA